MKDTPAAARGFVEALHLSYPMVVDEQSEAAQAYGVRALPTVVLIDKRGRLRYQGFELPDRAAIEQVL